MLAKDCGQRADGCGPQHDDPWLQLPDGEKRERDEDDAAVGDGVDGAGPDGPDKRGDKDANDAGVDSFERGPDGGPAAHSAPEGQDRGDEEQAGEEDGKQGHEAKQKWMRVWLDCGSEIGREGEEGAREGLSRSVAGEEG